MTKTIYSMDENEIYDFIKSQLPVKLTEKNKYGEVFTDPELINKMLDLFPSTVWSNPDLKWLDPSVGAGFFMIFVYLRLMEGLSTWETNKKQRSNHIIGNMLYMVELNKTNCNICKSIFGSNVNLICGDFLATLKFHGRDDITFDCIVGNPPFQDDHGLTHAGKRINGGKSKLYERIFIKSYDMLKQGGYISFVVPDNIFSGNGVKSYKIMSQNDNHVKFVSFNSNNQGYFEKIQQPVCYFILQKGVKKELTNIEHDEKNTFKILLKDRPVNPIRNWTLKTEKLIEKFVSSERNNVVYNRGHSIASYKGNKYPIIYTETNTLHTNNIEFAPGLGIKKAVIFSISPDLAFKMDYDGTFGAGPNTFYIPFKTNKEGKHIESFLKSDEYKTLALATKTTRQYLKISFIEHVKLTKLGTPKYKTHKMKTIRTMKLNKKSKPKKTRKQIR